MIGLTTVIVASHTDGRGEPLPAAIVLALLAGLAVGGGQRGLVCCAACRHSWPRSRRSCSCRARSPRRPRRAVGRRSRRRCARWAPTGIAGIPVPLWVFAALAAVVGLVLARGTAGRRIYATGANPRAAALSGVRVGGGVAGAT